MSHRYVRHYTGAYIESCGTPCRSDCSSSRQSNRFSSRDNTFPRTSTTRPRKIYDTDSDENAANDYPKTGKSGNARRYDDFAEMTAQERETHESSQYRRRPLQRSRQRITYHSGNEYDSSSSRYPTHDHTSPAKRPCRDGEYLFEYEGQDEHGNYGYEQRFEFSNGSSSHRGNRPATYEASTGDSGRRMSDRRRYFDEQNHFLEPENETDYQWELIEEVKRKRRELERLNREEEVDRGSTYMRSNRGSTYPRSDRDSTCTRSNQVTPETPAEIIMRSMETMENIAEKILMTDFAQCHKRKHRISRLLAWPEVWNEDYFLAGLWDFNKQRSVGNAIIVGRLHSDPIAAMRSLLDEAKYQSTLYYSHASSSSDDSADSDH